MMKPEPRKYLYKSFVDDFNQALEGLDINTLPKKYRTTRDNFDRVLRPIRKIQAANLKKGLDFGCGTASSLIIGKHCGLDITGLDIPHSEAGGPPAITGETPYLHMQNALQTMGYCIILRDTTVFPWDEFKDDEFDFVLMLFSINKEFMHKKLDLMARLKELIRVTRPNGNWYVWPSNHLKLLQRQPQLFQTKNIGIFFAG